MATYFHKDYNKDYIVGQDIIDSEVTVDSEDTVLDKIIAGKPAEITTETKNQEENETVYLRNDRIRSKQFTEITENNRKTFEIDQFEATADMLPGAPVK
jgi:ketol-acid reductoisomerase